MGSWVVKNYYTKPKTKELANALDFLIRWTSSCVFTGRTCPCCLLWIDEAKANIKPIYECRCNGRLQTKRFTRLSHTGLTCCLLTYRHRGVFFFFWKGEKRERKKSVPAPLLKMTTKKDTAYVPSNILLTGMQCMWACTPTLCVVGFVRRLCTHV